MNDIKKYPLALQLLMQTDGTVTELIKLLANEDIKVIKLSENIATNQNLRVLDRHIYLQGVISHRNWLYAESKIYLDNLPESFVDDLLNRAIPIGTLWNNYRIETFKQVTEKKEMSSLGKDLSGYSKNSRLLSRTYQVFSLGILIMEIKENFPISKYEKLII